MAYRRICHYELPVSPLALITDARLYVHGRTMRLLFDYDRDGQARKAGITFSGVCSMRHRLERYCTSWHVKPYDRLLEMLDSEWVTEQRQDIAPQYRDEFAAKHYMIYLESIGCFEALAEGFEVMPEEIGSW